MYLVIGLGKTGNSIARYLKRKELPFAIYDTRQEVHGLAEYQQAYPNVDIYLGNLPEEVYSQVDAVFTSPGVDCNLPQIRRFTELGILIEGDVELFAREVSAPVIAITGTNGKSTVTTLVGEMASRFEIAVAVAGNIGTPVLDLLDNSQQYGLWVLELSSFQLDLTSSLQPLGATILNISPDHIDRHGTFANYIQAKQRVYNNAEYVVYNRDDELTVPNNLDNFPSENVISYGLDAPQSGHWGLREFSGEIYLAHGTENVMPIAEAKLKGIHNWMNILAASALARLAGISYNAIKNALREFSGLAHRCEFIRNIDEVDWVNDSKGTNVGATVAAINGLGDSIIGKIVLIAGGQAKGAEFAELTQVVAKHVRAVIVIGEDAELITNSLRGVVDIVAADSMKSAVVKGHELAKAGDMVLLSPACASFDMFRDYNHRGDVFTQEVENL